MLFNRNRFLGFRVFLLSLLAIAFMYSEQHYRLTKVRSWMSVAVAPLQYMVDWPVKVIHWVETSFDDTHELRRENAVLKKNQLLQQAKLERMLALEQENQRLRALLSSSLHVGSKVVVAQLLAVDLAPFTQQVLLDKGERHGVYLGQPVLDEFGVTGQVISVGPITSRVMLVTDSRSAVPIQNNRNGVRAIAAGTGMLRELQLLYVPDTADFHQGDMLVTSGLGQRYPVGYPLGVVTKVGHRVGDRFASVIIKPIAHVNQSRHVLLVWPDQPMTKYSKDNIVIHSFGQSDAKTEESS